MKQPILLSLLIITAVAGCNDPQGAAVKDFMPGTYARRVQNEFSEGCDTLVITGLGNEAYGIEHRMSYRRIREGKPLPEERKVEKWTALYDEKTVALRETKRGRVLTFQPEQNTLFVGGSEYKKVQ